MYKTSALQNVQEKEAQFYPVKNRAYISMNGFRNRSFPYTLKKPFLYHSLKYSLELDFSSEQV